MQRDSIANTFVVAVSLCVVCAVLVSTAAVGLRSRQNANKQLDQQKNILMAAGLVGKKAKGKEVRALFTSRVETMMVNLDSGEIEAVANSENQQMFADFNAVAEAKSGDDSRRIVLDDDPARIKSRENKTLIYRIKDESGTVNQYVFPIRGYGLWSTLYGYLAVQADLETINGISYYQHGETPGLGGEVENVKWKSSWQGKRLYDLPEPGSDTQPTVAIDVVKGLASTDTEIDGLSGATITSTGVENMIQFWFGDKGFLPFIESLKASEAPTGA